MQEDLNAAPVSQVTDCTEHSILYTEGPGLSAMAVLDWISSWYSSIQADFKQYEADGQKSACEVDATRATCL
jgi:hypothetical protein